MSLLRPFRNGEVRHSFYNCCRSHPLSEPSDSGLPAVVQIHIISRILTRVSKESTVFLNGDDSSVAHCPYKPLPRKVNNNDLRCPKHCKPLSRALFDLVLSCVCLNILYIFKRHQHHRLDEESGYFLMEMSFLSSSPSWKVLSAFVTFLSLPGLANIAPVARFVAIPFSFSMASNVVAMFKYKSDLERPGEGLLMISVCSSPSHEPSI
jgi:hypothetical protein